MVATGGGAEPNSLLSALPKPVSSPAPASAPVSAPAPASGVAVDDDPRGDVTAPVLFFARGLPLPCAAPGSVPSTGRLSGRSVLVDPGSGVYVKGAGCDWAHTTGASPDRLASTSQPSARGWRRLFDLFA